MLFSFIALDENSLFGTTQSSNALVIAQTKSSTLDLSVWNTIIHNVAYKLIALDGAEVNLCSNYVNIFTKTINFQVFDSVGLSSNIYQKTLIVTSGKYS